MVVTFQSVITIFLISLLLIMNKQIMHLKTLPLGYNPENVMVVYYPSDIIKNQYSTLQDKLTSLPMVKATGAGNHIIGAGFSGQGMYRYGSSPESRVTVNEYRILPGTCETFGLQLKKGRFFMKDNETDRKSVILNETAVKQLGLTDPIGKQVVMFDKPMDIIGVVKDFYYESTAQKIQPLVLTNYQTDFNYLYIRFADDINRNLATTQIAKILNEIDGNYILNARWSEDLNTGKYYREDVLSRSVTWGTLLSVIIAMMGLYAIHSFQILRRTKEIGIRKVLGSNVSGIIYLTTLKSVKWIMLAALIGIPAAFLASQNWLQNYANRIHPDVFIFIGPVLLQILLALIITFAESFRVATKNPVESLRYE